MSSLKKKENSKVKKIFLQEPITEHHYAKWCIYLTNWGILACAIQAWLAAFIVTGGIMIVEEEFGM